MLVRMAMLRLHLHLNLQDFQFFSLYKFDMTNLRRHHQSLPWDQKLNYNH
jgi:hypothetical protein